ncbi:hypothetical protein DXG01_000306 [Tephrocybe rancida]|nr:hypothetical protein DXG01_000306 [Tephrocybe rancida]
MGLTTIGLKKLIRITVVHQVQNTTLDTDSWDTPDPWGAAPAPWDDPMVVSASPSSPVSKVRRDTTLATRMFEPSDSWKQTHVTPFNLGLQIHTTPPLTVTPRGVTAIDRCIIAIHTQGVILIDQLQVGTKEIGVYPIQVPMGRSTLVGSVIIVGKYLEQDLSSALALRVDSLNHKDKTDVHAVTVFVPRVVLTAGDRSLSRGRPQVHKLPTSTSAGGSSLSGSKKESSPVKYSWDRPSSVSGKVSSAKIVLSSKALPSTQSVQKSSWSRSGSRSSIASTQASDRAPSHPPMVAPVEAKGTTSLPVANSKGIKPDINSAAKTTDVEMKLPVPTTTAVTTPVGTDAADPSVRTERMQDSVISPLSPRTEGKQLAPPPLSGLHATEQPSPPMVDNGSLAPQAQSTVNGSAQTNLPSNGTPPTGDKPKRLEGNNIEGKQVSKLPSPTMQPASPASHPTVAARNGVVKDSSQKAPAAKEPHDVSTTVVDHRTAVPTAVSLPTPVPTPQPTPDAERLPSPPLPENIPTEAKSLRDALRIVVMTRLLCDRQTREERVNPVLSTNQARAALNHQDGPSSTPEEVVKEVYEGPRHDQRMAKFSLIKGSLVERFEERQNALTKKVQRLKEEYLSLHERWLTHCAALDGQNKPAAPEPEIMQPAGRTTRRSTAVLGDAVRSDLEMEQIIASLGNDDATDPTYLSIRNLATIPDMISVTHGRIDYTFDNTNHLVENPLEYYGPHTGIDDWTESEKEIFLDRFAAHPKQFGMIAEHLPNKTAAQCVDYYYLHKKKHIDFRKVISQYAPNKRKRGRTGKKKGNGLLADIRQHDAEVHGENGSPRSSGRPSRSKKPMPPPELKEPKKAPPSRRRIQMDLTPSAGSATPTPEPETRRRGGRRSGAAPLSRTVSVSLEDAEEEATEEAIERPLKRPKRGGRKVIKSAATVTDEPSTPEAKTLELAESNGRRKSGASLSQWSDDDKHLFLTLLAQHGDDFKRIAASMPNKTTIQVSNYYKANCHELGLESVAAKAPKRSPTPEETEETQGAPTPSTVATPATEAPDEPMASLTPEPPYMNGASTTRKPETSVNTTDSQPVTMAWPTTRQATPPLPTSHVRGYYPVNGRHAPYYPPHPMPSAYGPPGYTYPHYSSPHYPPYDPSRMPYPIPDPNRHMPIPRHLGDNPYPVLPPHGQPPYHYSS